MRSVIYDPEFAKLRGRIETLEANTGSGGGGTGSVVNEIIDYPLLSNQRTREPIYSTIAAFGFDADRYPGQTFKFAATGYVTSLGDTMGIKLYNVSDAINESELVISSQLSNTVKSDYLNLSGSKTYEVQIKNNSATPRYVILSTAYFEISSSV